MDPEMAMQAFRAEVQRIMDERDTRAIANYLGRYDIERLLGKRGRIIDVEECLSWQRSPERPKKKTRSYRSGFFNELKRYLFLDKKRIVHWFFTKDGRIPERCFSCREPADRSPCYGFQIQIIRFIVRCI
jgi:hypothetical protein